MPFFGLRRPAAAAIATFVTIQEGFMRRLASLLVVVVALAAPSNAEVKTVRMHIAGYLCGN